MTDTSAKRPATSRPATTWTVECGRCGHAFTVTREEIRSGEWIKRCPVCIDGGRERES